ncbi:AraC family transcriptional regulator [Sediminitomix flava]|uniref:AraC-like DNA-binding protein n=1 Tax=Sediminitomix flava TaxID=379075 RepID=A0A315ZG94_SEDFL|nr:helix-turn-helix transcriptional regulator [Sediminitomix flava]PWJ44173.1 AraC-like DNA-binding protein [Sediminitomix flava]
MTPNEDIVFFKGEDTGKGLPFGIVNSDNLLSGTGIFTPSLRDFHVIFWFKKGSGKYYIDFKEYELKPNTLILVPRDQVHYFAPLNQEECEIESIVFHPDYLYRNDNDIQHLFYFTVADHIEGKQILTLEKEECEHLTILSTQMKDVYYHWDREKSEQAFYHWLCLYLIYVERLASAQFDTETLDENAKLLLSFNELLEANYKTEYKVEYYMEKLQLNVKSFAKLTKERYKLSPKAVIDQRRILEIKRLLKGTDTPVKTIAYELGFDEPTNMVKYFKKHTGLTPVAFRTDKA